MEFERRYRSHTHIEIGPLVDVVFLLLLFFVLTSRMAVDRGLAVRLPEATQAETQPFPQAVLTLTAAGGFQLGKQVIDETLLTEALRAERARTNQPQLSLRADGGAQVDRLVRAMDAAKEAGFSDVTVVTAGGVALMGQTKD